MTMHTDTTPPEGLTQEARWAAAYKPLGRDDAYAVYEISYRGTLTEAERMLMRRAGATLAALPPSPEAPPAGERGVDGLYSALRGLYDLHATGAFTLPDQHYHAITAAAAALSEHEHQSAPPAGERERALAAFENIARTSWVAKSCNAPADWDGLLHFCASGLTALGGSLPDVLSDARRLAAPPAPGEAPGDEWECSGCGAHWTGDGRCPNRCRAERVLLGPCAAPMETAGACPDGLTPDGEVCPRCVGPRAPSGIDGGTWVHFPRGAAPGDASGATQIRGDILRDHPEYERRVQWDCVQQRRAVLAILARFGAEAVADEIDWVYRPALEDREWHPNHVAAPVDAGQGDPEPECWRVQRADYAAEGHDGEFLTYKRVSAEHYASRPHTPFIVTPLYTRPTPAPVGDGDAQTLVEAVEWMAKGAAETESHARWCERWRPHQAAYYHTKATYYRLAAAALRARGPRVDALKALSPYLQHHANCSAPHSGTLPCTCGLSVAVAALSPTGTGGEADNNERNDPMSTTESSAVTVYRVSNPDSVDLYVDTLEQAVEWVKEETLESMESAGLALGQSFTITITCETMTAEARAALPEWEP